VASRAAEDCDSDLAMRSAEILNSASSGTDSIDDTTQAVDSEGNTNDTPHVYGNVPNNVAEPLFSSSQSSSTLAKPNHSLPPSVRARQLPPSVLRAATQTTASTPALVWKAAAEVTEPWARFRFAAEHGGSGWRLQRLRRLFGADDAYAPNPNAAAPATATGTAPPAKSSPVAGDVASTSRVTVGDSSKATPRAFQGFTFGLDGLLIASHSEVELATKEYRKNDANYDPLAPLVVLAVDAAGVLSW